MSSTIGSLPRTAALVLAAGLALLPACDTATTPAAPLAGTKAASSLLALMVGAPSKVVFHGVRRYEAHWDESGVPQSLVYTEDVFSDGAGRFAIEPIDLIEPQLSQPEEDLFLVLQGMRQGLFFRYRDFQVRDLEAFTANYVALDAGTTVQVAGRTCAELEITAQLVPDRRYVVHVDVENGLVLRAREELLDGTLLGLSEYQSLSLAPDLSNVVWHQSLVDEQPLEPKTQAAVQALGFAPRWPKMVPDGFELLEFAKVVDPTEGDRPWSKAVYSDGVELLFLLQGQTEGPSFQVHTGQPHQPSEPDFRTALSVGPWTILRFRLHGRDLIAMGKLDPLVLQDLVESLF